MRRSCLYFFSQLFEIFFVGFSLKMEQYVWKVGFFWEDFFDAVNLPFHMKQLFLNGFLFYSQCLYIFINLWDFDIKCFLDCSEYFFLNSFAKIFNFVIYILYFFIFERDLGIYFLLYFIKFTVNLLFNCFNLLMNLSKLWIEFLNNFC